MTETFKTIIEQKKAAIIKVMEGIQDLTEQPLLGFPPDKELRKCTSPELVYLIALHQQSEALEAHAKELVDTIHKAEGMTESWLKEVLRALGKCDDSKGGASIGW